MNDKFVTLASLPYSKAEILRSLLESENIDCFIEDVDFLQDGIDTGVRVRILEKDARVAFPILEKMLGKVIDDPKKRENYVLRYDMHSQLLMPAGDSLSLHSGYLYSE